MHISAYLKKNPLALKILSSFMATCLFVVGLEQLTRLAIKIGWVQYQPPMITQLPPGTEDWRNAHMTTDKLRQPDPLLWWRPIETSPYNKQGFKGPLAAIPKPANTIRILVYGDSNTEGPPQDSWPARLQLVLNRIHSQTHHTYEVLNAGVAGYTSHQGLIRFQQEVGVYRPDIVLVAFGWNDVARGVQPDRSYRPPPAILVALERRMLKLHSYWALKQWVLRKSNSKAKRTVPRVPIEHYEDNLTRFASISKQYGGVPVLITRPHRESIEELHAMGFSFSSRVPEYNQALLRVASRINVHSIDAERHFLEAGRRQIWGDECHFTESGRIEMGEFVFQELKQFGLL